MAVLHGDTQVYVPHLSEVWYSYAGTLAVTYDPDQVRSLPSDEDDLVDPVPHRGFLCGRGGTGWIMYPVLVDLTCVRGRISRMFSPTGADTPPDWWVHDLNAVTQSLYMKGN